MVLGRAYVPWFGVDSWRVGELRAYAGSSWVAVVTGGGRGRGEV